MPTITNRFLQLDVNPDTGAWTLEPAGRAGPRIEAAQLGAAYTVGWSSQARRVEWAGQLRVDAIEPVVERVSPHGSLLGCSVHGQAASNPSGPIRLTVQFVLPSERPFLLWRISVNNGGSQPLNLDRIDLARVGPRSAPTTSSLALGPNRSAAAPPRLAFFTNAYQSWGFTGALQADTRQPSSIFGPLGNPKAMNLVTPRFRQPGHLTSDLFGVLGDLDAGQGLVTGFLSQSEQFGAVEVWLADGEPSLRLTAQCDGVRLEPGETRGTDWAYVQFVDLSDRDPLETYVAAAARENQARVPAHTPVGWCSWYQYFDKVTEADVLSNLDSLAGQRDRLPLEFVKLDDGFQAQVGDWFQTKPTCPHGLRWLADQVRARGQVPGLWLAPYIVRSDARLLSEHPDWFLRQPGGRLANAGYNWFRWCYGLDPTHPAVREHVRNLASVIALSGGMLLASDDMSRLRPERRRYLEALLPVLGASARAPGWLEQEMPDLFVLPLRGPGDLGEWVVAGVFNWDEAPRARVLSLEQLGLDPAAEHFVSEFWERERQFLPAAQPLRVKAIPPHGVRLLAIRMRRPAVPILAGSTFHFSQGGEIQEWTVSDGGLRARLRLDRVADGEWWLALPAPLRWADLDGQPVPSLEAGDRIYRLAFTVDRAQTLSITW